MLKGKQACWPVTELADRWLPHATAYDFADALQLVSEEAARLLVEGFGAIARFSIPRIGACPAPFASTI